MTFLMLIACSCKDGAVDSTPDVDDSASPGWCPEIPHPDIPDDRWSFTSTAPGGDLFTFDEAGGVIYAGSTMNGLYRSDDGGLSWEKKWADITHLAGQIAVDPEDPDRVAYTTGTLYWTLDGGETANRSMLGDEPAGDIPRVRGLIYDDGFLALTEDGSVWEVEPMEEAVLRGVITPEARPPHGDDTSKFEPDASWWSLAKGDGVLYAAQQGTAVYRSTDAGESWETVQLLDLHVSTFGASGDSVWVGGNGVIALSEDQGESWQTWEHGVDFRGLWLADDGLVVADREQLWTPNDDGGLDPLGPPGGEVHELRHLDALADGTLVLLHRDGVYLSEDVGETWSHTGDGLEVVDLGPLLAHPTCAPLVWVGTQCERGLFESVDGWGDSLRYVDEYLHYVMVPRVSLSRDREIWVTTDDVLKKSDNLGATWEILGYDQGLDVHQHGLDVHPEDGDIALSGTVGSGTDGSGDDRARIYRTVDGGLTWEDVSDGIPDSEASIHAIHFVQGNPDVVLAGTYYGGDFVHRGDDPGFGLLRSTDAGATWAPLEIDGVQNVPVFAECDGRVYAATDGGLLSSDDEGASWTAHKDSDREFLTVACHGDTVLAMDYDGIYRSDDRGESWSDWTTGADQAGWFNRMMPQLAVSADGHMAYAAIPLIGLLRRPL